MSAHVTWQSKSPPETAYLIQWEHEEFERDGKKDIRRMHVWCDEQSASEEIKHLVRRRVKFWMYKYSLHPEGT